MLTPRGWWLLAIVFGTLLVAVSLGARSLLFVSGTLVTWLLAAWIRFAWITRRVPEQLTLRRELRTAGGPVQALWARQSATVHVELLWDGNAPLPFVLAVDRVPALAHWLEHDPWTGSAIRRSEPLRFEYRIVCPSAGRLRFDGVKVTVTDLQGFFHRTAFVRARVDYRVLPPLVDAPDGPSQRKRQNSIPLLGTHRLRRPGTGSELLDLRDYVPSDPPKLIAWKASAKRDRLITKELESEVPLRCTLFVDVSSSVRVGPVGGNALARLVEIAAAVLHANTEMRDLTGLCLVEENGIGRILRPARGRRAFFERLQLLADVADLPPAHDQRDLARLVPLALGLAQDIYPDWLHREVNHTPWYAPSFWFEANRWRKKVAAVLAHHYHLGPGGVALLYHDDDTCQRFLLRWLTEHRVAYPVPLYDAAGRYAFRFPQKVEWFARAVLDFVTRGKDNELFVLLVDLFDQNADLTPLTRTVKVALARHHQVQVICPWPPGVPLPDAAAPAVPSGAALQTLLNQAWTKRLHESIFEVRRAFRKLGVPVLAAPQEQAVALVLERLQRLRAATRR